METSQETVTMGLRALAGIAAMQPPAAEPMGTLGTVGTVGTMAGTARTAGGAPANAWDDPGALTASCLTALIDELDVGLIVCRADGRLVHANAAAWRELDGQDAIALKPADIVAAVAPDQQAPLRQAVEAAARGRRQLVLLRRHAVRLMVAVQPMSSRPGAPERVLLILGRRRVATALMVEMLCRRQGVTAAEQRVLEGLLEGLSAQELARQFDVELSTVRTQVSALRSKLGVRRIDDALLMLAELPPMASALRHGGCRSEGRVPAMAA